MNSTLKKANKHPFQQFLIGLAAFISTQIIATPLSLETAPLFTTNSVKPNLILAIDDSGSMDSEVLFPSNDGALWWSIADEMFVSAGAVNYNTAGAANDDWKKFVYLFPNGIGGHVSGSTGNGQRVYGDFDAHPTNSSKNHAHFAIPPIKQYAFARSSEYNKMYYDPDVTYEPWADYGGTSFGDITKTAAPSDPISGTSTLNLTVNRYSTSQNNVFKIYPGMKIPTGTYYDNGGTKTLANADVPITIEDEIGIQYYPATYYVKKETGTYSGVGTGNCTITNTAHYTAFHAAPSALSGVDALGPDGQCLTKIEIQPATTSYLKSAGRTDCVGSDCSYDEEIQNFANWYSYYRKRHIALRAGMGQAFVGFEAIRTGIFTINNRTDVTMWDMSSASDTFYSTLYDIDGNSGGTPNRQAVDHAGQQFMRTNTGAPITEECQKNFTLFFTDGFASLGGTLPTVTDQDNDEGLPYADGYSNTIADIALNYYETTLRTDAGFPTGQVPKALGCDVASPDPQLDCNANLHMNTYTIGMGAKGTIFGETHFNVADAYAHLNDDPATGPVWPDVNTTRDNTQIDDLYHAAVNGRGEMFNAASASDLQTKLKSALLGIQGSIGVASAVTFNTATLETNSAVYLAFFNSANWSGDLLSFELSSDGSVNLSPSWSAADILDSGSPVNYDTRRIITHNGSDGVSFRWASLTSDQQDDLNAAPVGGGSGEDALNFIRGERSNEGPGQYRVRGSILGDMVNAAPVFVGTPSLNWPASGFFPTAVNERYSDFRYDLLLTPRTEVVYVGANDGMLHGFKASTGEELLAYIPGFTYSDSTNEGLHYLADPLYSHQYYVDLAPTVSDVYINTGSGDAWHSILIGGGRAGGRGLFALDVTNPANFSEANAANIALWEFTHADLGYTYSKPTVVMMNNGKWAAVFGNGYNDTGTGEAKLFILFIEEGIDGNWAASDYKIISTGVGSTTTPNGLATPAVVDTDGNGTADRAYAGDLEGNMWAFDLSGATVASWVVATNSARLFIAKDSSGNSQPITQKPSVAFHIDPPGGSHDPNLMVFFGTGKYLESDDLTSTSTQTFYGIWDDGTPSIDRSDLIGQTLTVASDVDSNGNALRLITDNTVNYSNKNGWYIDLPASGERSVVNSQTRGSLVFFNTWIPSSSPCSSGGTGFLMSVEQLNGGEPDSPAFDVNGISGVNEYDIVDGDKNATGQEYSNGLPARSTFLSNKQYTPGTGGELIQTREVQDLGGAGTGRLSWEQLLRK